ncbi:hypothetical protein SJZ72_27540, partial [Klebsiella pneumoniae]|nr:hypothetical protein [Klebsiella pneumoniae]
MLRAGAPAPNASLNGRTRATFDAVFVGLTIRDIAGRPVVAIPPRGGVAFIEQSRLNPAGPAAGANINAAKLGIRTAAVA